ncbi:MAG TPA: TAXI family TRAP transporter solute-binding subunit, partial [Usitatibacter sp.]
ATSQKIVVVPIPADVVKKIGDAAYQPATIPANTYDGQDHDVPTAAIQNFLVTREGVSADVVYKMTKAVFENKDALVAAHTAAKGIDKANAVKSLPVPLHPGAEKYFKEIGVLK